ncbi:hypothetical protein [Sphingomonas sp. PP-CC-3G-468]|uniref:hypothetical protein n=1 Tax=Sphingomonas sp. PP-CC-3G-468 TaxID=2135656 RepID=UPI0010447463|nr:hypothetical protein [Sphingomonas sp. PP-CC-3G-468]TCM02936.1 hypothetical protein C8J41_11239 [Sphingomonas sp. PP-CC-3G-468]
MAINIAVLLAAVGAAGWLALQLYHVVSTVIAARQNIRDMKDSGDHPAGIRLSVEAQTKLMFLDIRLGVLFGIGLLGLMIGIVGFLRTMIAGGR